MVMISASGRLAQGNSVTRITDHPNMNLTVDCGHNSHGQSGASEAQTSTSGPTLYHLREG